MRQMFILTVLSALADASRHCKITDKEVLCAEKDLDHIPRVQNSKQYENLDMSGNDLEQLMKVDLHEFPNLKYLRLNYNDIMYIEDTAFEGLLLLETLDLSMNILEEVPDEMIANNGRLVTLDLSGNMFNARTPALTSTSLEYLDLSSSKLSYFREENVKELPSLKVLNLASNNLVRLDAAIFRLPKNFAYVDVNHNMWECDCESVQLFKALTDGKLFEVQKTVTCSKSKTFYEIYDKSGPVSRELYCKEAYDETISETTSTTTTAIPQLDQSPNYDKIARGIKSLEEILRAEKLYFQDLRKEKEVLDSVAMVTIKILIFVIFMSGIALGVLISTIMNRRIRRIKSRAILRSASFT